LLEGELLHLIGCDADVPEILIHVGKSISWSAGRRARSVGGRLRTDDLIRAERIFIDSTDFSPTPRDLCIDWRAAASGGRPATHG
jgi:hypothetical protein